MEGCFPSCPEGTLFSDIDNDCVPRDICLMRREQTVPGVEATPTPDFVEIPVVPQRPGLGSLVITFSNRNIKPLLARKPATTNKKNRQKKKV